MEKTVPNVTEESLEELNVKQLLQQLIEMNDLLYQNANDRQVVEEVTEVQYDIICTISNKLGI